MTVYLAAHAENWKKALDSHKCAAACLVDLSKAFGCFPCELLIELFEAYWIPLNTLKLRTIYLSNRLLHVRRGSHGSTCTSKNIMKHVREESYLGPLLLNVFTKLTVCNL